MKWLLIIPGLLLGLVVLFTLIGALLPRTHTATLTTVFQASPETVYSLIRDFPRAPAWRPEIKSSEWLQPRAGRLCFRETSRHGAITYLVLADTPGQQLITQIADDQLPFGGTWTFVFTATNTGTQLQVTEDGTVKNPLFRFLSRFIFGHTRTLDNYLTNLKRALGD